jgi:hypothetical protein
MKGPPETNPLTGRRPGGFHRNFQTDSRLHLDGQPITRLYKGGQLPRSSHSHIGKIDLVGALEQSSNIYFAILAAEHLKDPAELAKSAKLFSFGTKTGIELPGETLGNVPDDVAFNRTSLYSFAIGQHSLVVTPLQTALMASTIANHGVALRPKIVKAFAGKERDIDEEESAFDTASFPFQEELGLVGISFPLFVETQKEPLKNFVANTPSEIKTTLELPDPVRNLILEGMYKAISGPRGTARAAGISAPWRTNLMSDFDTKNTPSGKPNRRNFYKHSLDRESEVQKVSYVWFAGIPSTDSLAKKSGKIPNSSSLSLRFERARKKRLRSCHANDQKWREIKRLTSKNNWLKNIHRFLL